MTALRVLDNYLDQALDSLAGPFARLVFLASLRDAYTGRYLHEGWMGVASPEEVHRTLRGIHRDVFKSVLNQPLLETCKELRGHFKSLGEAEFRTATLWLEIEPFREMIPEGCSPVERRIIISQVRTALEVLMTAPYWTDLEGPSASPHLPPGQPLQPRFLN